MFQLHYLQYKIDTASRYVLIQIWSFCTCRKASCGGCFAYLCIEKLAFVDYLCTAPKNPLSTGLEFVRSILGLSA